MHTDIKIRAFTGAGIKMYLSNIARLRVEVFQEFPYLQNIDYEQERHHLERYTQCPEAIAVIVFDFTTIVGASTGIPLEKQLPFLQKPFLEHKLNPSSYYYFSDSILLRPYRGRGILHHFFDIRESFAKDCKRFEHACFCTINREENHPLKPQGYMPLNDFWRKRGYLEHKELSFKDSFQDVGEKKPSEKTKVFWVKDIKPGQKKSYVDFST